MPEGQDQDDLNESGSALRSKLESALAEKASMAAQLAELKAKDVIREQGLALVKVDDLKGLKADEIEAKAAALQEERAALQRELVKDALQKQGLEGDVLEERLTAFLAGDSGTGAQAPAAVEGISQLSRVGGNPVATPPSQLRGIDAIQAALES